jgi:hypothetical protein
MKWDIKVNWALVKKPQFISKIKDMGEDLKGFKTNG